MTGFFVAKSCRETYCQETDTMRQGPQIKRQRGRGQGGYQGGNQGNGGGGNNNRKPGSMRHQTFDSNGPDTRVRGTAIQVYEKYMSLARDATSSGDRVMAENYYQHAEHYYRIIASFSDGQPYIPQHMQQRDAFDQEQDDERNPQANGSDDGAALDPNGPDAPQPDFAAADQPRFDDRREPREDRREPRDTRDRDNRDNGERRERRDFRDRRPDRDGFRQDGRTENRAEQVDFNEQPAFLRQPTRRPRDENEPREDRREPRENRRYESEGRGEPRGRQPRQPYQSGYDAQPEAEQPSPVTVITPAGGGLPHRAENPRTEAPRAEAPRAEAARAEPVAVEAAPVVVAAPAPEPVAVEAPTPVVVPITVAAEAALPLDLPADADAPAEPPKRKRGRPPKAKPPVEA